MTTLADDLLKSRTIPELRDLISSLEKDANGKKTELQQMVGSKYHDFIQSADKITEMRTKSEMIEKQIVGFWNCNQELIVKTHELLNQTLPENHKKAVSTSQESIFADLTSSKLWSYLNNCDVLEASKMISAAGLFNNNKLIDGTSSLWPYLSRTSQTKLSNLKLSRTQQSENTSLLSLTETVLDDAKLCLLDDSATTTTEGTTTSMHTAVLDKAKSLAAISILSHLTTKTFTNDTAFGSKAAVTAEVDLLGQYFEVADIRIHELFDGDLSVHSTQHGHGHKGRKNTGPATPDVDVLSRGLTSLVTVLQEIIMDLYLMFFHTISTNADVDSVGGEANGSGTQSKGLVAFYQADFIQSLITQLQNHIHSLSPVSPAAADATALTLTSARATAVANAASKAIEFDFNAYLTDLNSSNTDVSLKDRVNVWLTGALKLVTERCKVVLSSLTNASDVAMLQQRIWRVCTTITSSTAALQLDSASPIPSQAVKHAGRERSGSVSKNGSASADTHKTTTSTAAIASTTPALTEQQKEFASYSYTQSMWELACHELLYSLHNKHVTPKGRSRATQKQTASTQEQQQQGKSTSTNVLYSTVFRISFMHQVERLLHKSCTDILNKTKGTIVQALSLEGVIVDVNTFAVKLTADTTTKDKTKSRDSSRSGILSHRIYNIAEYIRKEFEHLIATLYINSNGAPLTGGNISPPGSAGLRSEGSDYGVNDDPHAAQALTKTLKIHCSQLVGQLFVFLRLVLESCRDALISHGMLLSSTELNGLFTAVKDTKHALISKELQVLLKSYCTNNAISSGSSGVLSGLSGSSLLADKSTTVGNTVVSFNEIPLLSSILLIGRLAWLFKIRGNFLESALKPLPASNKPSTPSSMSNVFGKSVTSGSAPLNTDVILNSEDQFRSAFEIADTNGDGILNYSEAIEAIQALTLGDTSQTTSFNGNGQDGNTNTNSHNKHTKESNAYPGLSSTLTPDLTYYEFSLIVGGQLISTTEQNPVGKLHSCLDNLIAFTHILYALTSVLKQSGGFVDALSADLGLSTNNGSIALSEAAAERLFKISWINKCVAGDESDLMLVPTVCSSALSVLLFNINRSVLSAVLSIDTMQTQFVSLQDASAAAGVDISGTKTVSAEDFDDLEVDGDADDVDTDRANILSILTGVTSSKGQTNMKMLSQITTRLVYQLSFALIYKSYGTLHNQLKQLQTKASQYNTGLRNSGTTLEALLEDMSLQVLFDLMICEQLAGQYNNHTMNNIADTLTTTAAAGVNKSNSRSLSFINNNNKGNNDKASVFTAMHNLFYNNLDSITAELILPLLQETSVICVYRMSLLFPVTFQKMSSQDAFSAPTGVVASGSATSTSEQILARIFPNSIDSSTVSGDKSGANAAVIGRFPLLPLALLTSQAPAAVSSGRSGNVSGSASRTSLNASPSPGGGSMKGTSSSTTNLSGVAFGSGKSVTATAATAMKWW